MEVNNLITPDTIVKFTNCKLLRGNSLVKDDLWIRDGKIIDQKITFFDERNAADVVVDCNGAILSPGFIDIQVNGGYGIDFSSPTECPRDKGTTTGLEKVARYLLRQGVTSFCPTVITSSPDTYRVVLPRLRLAGNHLPADVAQSLGLHLEGPFISREKRGMHPDDLIRPLATESAWSVLNQVYGSLEGVAMVTLAPELPGCAGVIGKLVERNVRVCVGHSMASLEEGEAAVLAGASIITHLFSSMLPFHHRDPHLVGLLTSDIAATKDTVYFGLIADLLHTHAAALRIAQRSHPAGVLLVTDANPALGLPDGEYCFGEKVIDVRDGKSYIQGSNTLAGATAPLDLCVRNFYQSTGVSSAEALLTVTRHPAEALGLLQTKGTLSSGSTADLVLLSSKLEVLSTWIRGKLVYRADACKLTAKKLT